MEGEDLLSMYRALALSGAFWQQLMKYSRWCYFRDLETEAQRGWGLEGTQIWKLQTWGNVQHLTPRVCPLCPCRPWPQGGTP